MVDWTKLYEMEDLKEIAKIVEKEGTEDEFTAFRCAVYLHNKLNEWALLYTGMNFTNIDKAMDNIPDRATEVAKYLSLSMTSEQLRELEAMLITLIMVKKG